MITACIVLLYISYAIPIICLLVRGRNNIRHGPFWMGPFGLFANIVLLLWTLFTLVMYSFPPVQPVVAGSKCYSFICPGERLYSCLIADMNYVSAVYGIVVFIVVIDWFVRGKAHYRGQTLRHEEAALVLNAEARVMGRGSI